MAMEVHVFFRGKLPDKKALSRAMAELGFPLTIAAGSLEKQRGFMPMRLRREETGVEFDVFNERAAVEELGGKDIDPGFERSANFRWGGDEDEMLAGVCAAAALAKLVNGVVFEEEEGKLLSVDEAIALARRTVQATLKPEEAQRRGTRPADIKRYLKPLLKQRSDLVLIGRLLLIRPVRHILRGAFLERGGEDRFYAYRFMNLLCRPLDTRPYEGSKGTFCVWQPHFEPLLMDTLAEDIFEPVGKITSLEDFAAAMPDEEWFPLFRVTALLLSGARDQAMAYVQQVEKADRGIIYRKPWAAERDRLAWDIGKLCETFHAREAETVKALKLQSIWEPSPFPVELPAVQRKQRTDEPLFIPSPWLQRPEWLVGDLPEQVGDVRFAKGLRHRAGRLILDVPLSREQAEERHRNWEDYVLVARPPDGLLLSLGWNGRDRLDPYRVTSRADPVVNLSRLRLVLRGSEFVIEAVFNWDLDVEDVLTLGSLEVRPHAARWSTWDWVVGWRDGENRMWDRRSGEERFAREPLTDAERDQWTLLPPGFGEFDKLVRMVRDVLRSKGYGEIT